MKDSKSTPNKASSDEGTSPLWGGRFADRTAPLIQRYTGSLHLDRELALFDIYGSQAHVKMLREQNLITEEDHHQILKGLNQIADEIRRETFPFRPELEDIHMNIEYRLEELVGEAARHLHTARSRNDQVAVDLRMYSLAAASTWAGLLRGAIEKSVQRAEQSKENLLPGWTHLQAAQPLSWGQYLLSFAEMFFRDYQRVKSYRQLHAVSPLGAGALAGSTLHIDPERTSEILGFSRSFSNSYDVVGDRDAVLELLQIGSQIMIHLSRLSEDFIFMTSTPVAWVVLPDSLCTGSSMMPQKKNPDALELMRGKTASVLGHTQAMTTLLKGLPTSYNRDLQQDKEHLFPAVNHVEDSLRITHLLFEEFSIDLEACRQALSGGFLLATDLAEYLVAKGVAFREAHHQVGRLVALAEREGLRLQDVELSTLQQIAPRCGADVKDVLSTAQSLERRRHKGSSGRNSIDFQLEHWRRWLQETEHLEAAPFGPDATAGSSSEENLEP